MGPVQQTTLSIHVQGPQQETLAREFRAVRSQWQLLLCRSGFTICALLYEAILDPRMRYTSKQAQNSWRSFPLHIYDQTLAVRTRHLQNVQHVCDMQIQKKKKKGCRALKATIQMRLSGKNDKLYIILTRGPTLTWLTLGSASVTDVGPVRF